MTTHPRDYVTSSERTNMPKAERRSGCERREWEDKVPSGVLMCLSMFGILGMSLGMLVMWLVMA